MTMLSRAGKLLLGGSMVMMGYGAAKEPGGRTAMAGPTLAKMREFLPLPADDEMLVRVNGAVQTGAGATLAVGVLPRLSALALAGSLIPTTYAGHPFWTVEDPAQRAAQRIQFLKNAALVGGLLVVAGS